MTSTLRQSLIGALLAAGVPDDAEAARIADLKEPGSSWINTVLNSGKVDEAKLLTHLGENFRMPFEPRIDATPHRPRHARPVPEPVRVPAPDHPAGKHARPAPDAGDLRSLQHRRAASWPASSRAASRSNGCSTSRAQLLRTIKTLYGVGAETFDELLKARGGNLDDLLTDKELVSDINANDPEASVVKFVNQIIREAIAERATDIHVEPLENDLRIRYRIDGILHEAAVPPQLRVLQSAIISRLKVMARMDIAEKRLPQDGRINLRAGTTSIDVRVSTIPTVNGESISLRLLSGRDRESFGFEQLDLDEHQTKLVKALLAQPNGIVMVTGPTGSGKSTTLYSFLTSINSVQRRIITIEEPVEYRLPGVSQIDVKPEIGLSFANGLRHILRQDPNVIMVGEIRDGETADIAIRAALTGHLVFSHAAHERRRGRHHALAGHGHRAVPAFEHGAGVPGATARADDLPALQAPRRSIRRGHLREIGFPVEVGHHVPARHGLRPLPPDGLPGTHGDPRDLRHHGPAAQADREQGGRQHAQAGGESLGGMKTLRHDGWRRVIEGRTTIEEVLRVTQEDESLAEE